MILLYNETGKIYHAIFDPVQPDLIEHYKNSNETFLILQSNLSVSDLFDKHFVENNELTKRPEIEQKLTVENNILSFVSLPDMTEIQVSLDGEEWHILEPGDTSLTFSNDCDVIHYRLIAPFPHMEKTGNVTLG